MNSCGIWSVNMFKEFEISGFIEMVMVYINKLMFNFIRKVKVSNDQEMAQSESNSHSKNRGGKKLN